jgi:lipid-A-disaccharide synthase-like uncharacterized protein
MDWMSNLFGDGKFLGIEWNTWKIIGWMGNAVFFSRFFLQWYATERRKQVVVPPAFWWLSLAGSGLLLSYALFYRRDSVFIFAYLFTWIPYIRNRQNVRLNPTTAMPAARSWLEKWPCDGAEQSAAPS